jgi:hypothetical protein
VSQAKSLDLDKLRIINAQEVPARATRATPYHELLKRISKGKAVVITEKEANIHTIGAGIRRQQKRGEFKRIILTQRRGEDGVMVLYIINPSDEDVTVDGKRYRRKE